MHSVLLFVEQPDFSDAMPREIWDRFLGETMRLCQDNAAVDILGQSCWQIPLQSNTDTFAAFLSAAYTHRLTYRLLFFPDMPQWIGSLHPPS
jgi:hypothetical protein